MSELMKNQQFFAEDFIMTTCASHLIENETHFDQLIKNKWKEADSKNVMNYKVDSIKSKILPGDFKIVAQLNPQREQKRRRPASILSFKQPFDPKSFNFTQIKDDEILSEITLELKNFKVCLVSLIVNTAPICPYHNLLVPNRMSSTPQVLNEESLTAGISSILLSGTPTMKVGFNSLGGMASVNHNHWHIYYLPHPLAIETAKCKQLVGPVYTFTDHYAPGFIFSMENADINNTVKMIMMLINLFMEEEICHNVMITRGLSYDEDDLSSKVYDRVRICIWARKPSYGIKEVSYFASALCEFAGHLPVYSDEAWDTISEEEVVSVLNGECRETFESIVGKVKDLYS